MAGSLMVPAAAAAVVCVRSSGVPLQAN
eukprot:SAG22_NODE_16674_length_320_cov_0.918552_1_plen_27_part_01